MKRLKIKAILMRGKIKMSFIKRWIFSRGPKLVDLEEKVFYANNYKEVMKVFGWSEEPSLERPDLYDFNYIEDLNERRVRDTEVIATVVKNTKAKVILEIGTSAGLGTVLISKNAPESEIYTVNITAEEILQGKGGINTTIALEEAKIGIEYKKRNLSNITQILANTATWEPNIGSIDVAFIDGSHDKDFVVNDTLKVLNNMPSGGFIMWHDFNPSLRKKFHWINDVCEGVEELYRLGALSGRIIILKDSWVGVYKKP